MPRKSSPKKSVWEKAFLKALAITGNVTESANKAKIDPSTAHHARKRSKGFSQKWKSAMRKAADALEAEARRRAVDGLVRFKFDKKGEPIKHPKTGEPYFELEYSDTLLIFLMKGNNPAKFRERHEVKHKGGVQLQLTEEIIDAPAKDNPAA